MLRKKLICIEGSDRVGKFTQAKMLAERLSSVGKCVKRIEIPVNDGVMYRLIYRMLRTGSAKNYPNLFQFVQFLNKFLFQLFVLPFLLLTYDYVILDRWALSSIVYGDASGASVNFTRVLFWSLFEPIATIVLLGRARGECNEDVYERDKGMQALVRAGYYFWSAAHDNVFGIDCERSIDDVHNNIVSTLVRAGVL